jgi:hypothetical protein
MGENLHLKQVVNTNKMPAARSGQAIIDYVDIDNLGESAS